jgi:pyruvate ferredoxin oxidoreductase delta subunit
MMKVNTGATVTEPGSSVKNKTGGWRNMRPVTDLARCKRCGICVILCPDAVISMKNKEEGPRTDYNYCKGCGICANECPFKAISMVAEEK